MTVKQKQDDILNHIQKSVITSSTSQQALLQYKFSQDERGYLYSYFGSQFELALEIKVFDSPLVQVQHKLGMRQLDHQLRKLLHTKWKKTGVKFLLPQKLYGCSHWPGSFLPNRVTQFDNLVHALRSHTHLPSPQCSTTAAIHAVKVICDCSHIAQSLLGMGDKTCVRRDMLRSLSFANHVRLRPS